MKFDPSRCGKFGAVSVVLADEMVLADPVPLAQLLGLGMKPYAPSSSHE